jgi:peptidoglycan hydrolase FlgJ
MIHPTSRTDWASKAPMPATSPMPSPLANSLSQSSHRPHAAVGAGTDATRDAFRDFVGQTLFGQMMQSMRSSVGKPAYFHGGRGEEVFQQQLDSVLVEKISDASASTVADPMYELFRLQRGQ